MWTLIRILVKMTLVYDWFQNIVTNQNWKKVQTPNEVLLIASAEKNDFSFLTYTNASRQVPVMQFQKNSVVALRDGRIWYDTDSVIPDKKPKKKSKSKR